MQCDQPGKLVLAGAAAGLRGDAAERYRDGAGLPRPGSAIKSWVERHFPVDDSFVWPSGFIISIGFKGIIRLKVRQVSFEREKAFLPNSHK